MKTLATEEKLNHESVIILNLFTELETLNRNSEVIGATGQSVLGSHLRELVRQIRLPKEKRVYSVLKSSWQVVLRYKNDPSLKPFLIEHGEKIVEFLITAANPKSNF